MCYSQDYFNRPRTRKFKVGDTVRLRTGVQWDETAIRDGREANKTAVVTSVYGDDNDRIMTGRDLMGCRYWNEEDLALVKGAK